MPHDPQTLRTTLLQAASPELELSFRSMFGGIMAYAGGRAFASLSDVGLAFKLAGADHAALSAKAGAAPLRYAPNQPASKSYVVVPDAMLSDPATLGAWAARSVAGLKPAAKATKPVVKKPRK